MTYIVKFCLTQFRISLLIVTISLNSIYASTSEVVPDSTPTPLTEITPTPETCDNECQVENVSKYLKEKEKIDVEEDTAPVSPHLIFVLKITIDILDAVFFAINTIFRDRKNIKCTALSIDTMTIASMINVFVEIGAFIYDWIEMDRLDKELKEMVKNAHDPEKIKLSEVMNDENPQTPSSDKKESISVTIKSFEYLEKSKHVEGVGLYIAAIGYAITSAIYYSAMVIAILETAVKTLRGTDNPCTWIGRTAAQSKKVEDKHLGRGEIVKGYVGEGLLTAVPIAGEGVESYSENDSVSKGAVIISKAVEMAGMAFALYELIKSRRHSSKMRALTGKWGRLIISAPTRIVANAAIGSMAGLLSGFLMEASKKSYKIRDLIKKLRLKFIKRTTPQLAPSPVVESQFYIDRVNKGGFVSFFFSDVIAQNPPTTLKTHAWSPKMCLKQNSEPDLTCSCRKNNSCYKVSFSGRDPKLANAILNNSAMKGLLNITQSLFSGQKSIGEISYSDVNRVSTNLVKQGNSKLKDLNTLRIKKKAMPIELEKIDSNRLINELFQNIPMEIQKDYELKNQISKKYRAKKYSKVVTQNNTFKMIDAIEYTKKLLKNGELTSGHLNIDEKNKQIGEREPFEAENDNLGNDEFYEVSSVNQNSTEDIWRIISRKYFKKFKDKIWDKKNQ